MAHLLIDLGEIHAVGKGVGQGPLRVVVGVVAVHHWHIVQLMLAAVFYRLATFDIVAPIEDWTEFPLLQRKEDEY